MQIEIISPEKVLYKGNIESLIVPGSNGFFQILNNHAPIVSSLTQGVCTIKGIENGSDIPEDLFTSVKGSSDYQYTIQSGTVELQKNKIILLVE